ncbi:hypothetical protein RhiJN_23016 [Ceratobasidium sp. AG-Ba]|nr:hypothetical protein RhiJN_23016 [Ceratobasidium sp. AG-Ba]
MPRTFWGYCAPDENFIQPGIQTKYYPDGGICGSLMVAREIYNRLELYGPLRLYGCEINGQGGNLYAIGRDNAPRESLAPEIIQWMEKMYFTQPRLFTHNPSKDEWTVPRVGNGTEMDVIWRGSELKQVFSYDNSSALITYPPSSNLHRHRRVRA